MSRDRAARLWFDDRLQRCHASFVAELLPTIVLAPSVTSGNVAGERFHHYSLLRTTEDLLGLGRLGAAASAPSMTRAFGLY